jgi:hypothetical protein
VNSGENGSPSSNKHLFLGLIDIWLTLSLIVVVFGWSDKKFLHNELPNIRLGGGLYTWPECCTRKKYKEGDGISEPCKVRAVAVTPC